MSDRSTNVPATSTSTVVNVKSPTEQTPVIEMPVINLPPADQSDAKPIIAEMSRCYRAKPLMTSASQMTDSGVIMTTFVDKQAYKPTDWHVNHGGITMILTAGQFTGMYEVLDVGSNGAIDAGLPDLDPGAEIEREGKRLVRVEVGAGSGAIAYWYNVAADGATCGYRVTADNVDNPQASHRAGRFVEPWTGKSGERTWIEK